MPFLPIRDSRIYYEDWGPSTGRPLLLLHAALQTAESMEPLRDLLISHGFRAVAPDQRGHGRSTNPGRTLAIPMLADDMAGLMERLALERPLVVGYSLGGMVALELARRGLVSGLVVLAARIQPAHRGSSAFDSEHIRERSPVWARQLAEKHVEIPWQELATELGQLLETWPGFDQDALAEIQVPALVAQGDRDVMVPVEQSQELARQIPGAELLLLPRVGHPELLYRPDLLRAVQEFLLRLL